LTPVARISSAVTRAARSTSDALREQPRPMLWGKMTAPRTLLWPCSASTPKISGIRSRVFSDCDWNASYALVQSSSVLPLFGSPLPPASSDPRKYVCTSAGSFSAENSACTIWPTFSSSVMRASRARACVSKRANGDAGR
jgi:hypothetical protein